MIGSLEVTHELIFTIPSVIQISSISSINSIRLRFNLGKSQLIFIERVSLFTVGGRKINGNRSWDTLTVVSPIVIMTPLTCDFRGDHLLIPIPIEGCGQKIILKNLNSLG